MSFADTIFPWLLKLRRADGSLGDGQCDANGNLKVTVVAAMGADSLWVDPDVGAPLTHARLIASQGGRKLCRAVGVNEGTERRWFMLFDLPGLPPASAQPVMARPVAPGDAFAIEFPRPRTFRS